MPGPDDAVTTAGAPYDRSANLGELRRFEALKLACLKTLDGRDEKQILTMAKAFEAFLAPPESGDLAPGAAPA